MARWRRAPISGDRAQLLSVDSGTPFSLAQDRSALTTAVVNEVVRQRPELRPVIEAIIAGNIQTAIDTMNSVTPDVVPRQAGAELPEQPVVDAGDKVIPHILDDYRGRTTEAQKETLIVVQTNRDKDELNRGIHQILVEQGQLQGGRGIPILVRESTRTEALLSTAGLAQHAGKIALIQEQYYRIEVTQEGVKDGVVTLVDEHGKGHLLSAFESSLRDIGIYRQENRHIAAGEKINFTRTDKERGRVMNSDWTVSEVSENGKITITKGDESRQLDPTGALSDQHVNYGYAGTAHKAQGASSPYVIVLGGGKQDDGCLPLCVMRMWRYPELKPMCKPTVMIWLNGQKPLRTPGTGRRRMMCYWLNKTAQPKWVINCLTMRNRLMRQRLVVH
ncbi:hypothetical protein ABN197_16790 [Providencia alcalifaciens]|uniref:hypothetical protein n=1 Tax=Providencia alcalifaciens TaxID=126385 RepID=UPI0032DAF70F